MMPLLVYCRSGFEKDCLDEISDLMEVESFPGRVAAGDGSGFLHLVCPPRASDAKMQSRISTSRMIFARQVISEASGVIALTQLDRLTPMIRWLENRAAARPFDMLSGFVVEFPDNESGKELCSFCKAFEGPLMTALKKRKFLWTNGRGPKQAPRFHVFFLDRNTAYAGLSDPARSSPLTMGIPRLKLHRDAPSRSSLKLEEALMVFLGNRAESIFARKQTAVDLGAAPGGWTFELVRRGVKVIAVDNARMDPRLLATGMVTHLREDAFHYVPSKKVDWLCCDVVERPELIADLVARWLVEGYARQAIFNLKLPMKKRYAEVKKCLERFRSGLLLCGSHYDVVCKQLYHDRKEVTVFAQVT